MERKGEKLREGKKLSVSIAWKVSEVSVIALTSDLLRADRVLITEFYESSDSYLIVSSVKRAVIRVTAT